MLPPSPNFSNRSVVLLLASGWLLAACGGHSSHEATPPVGGASGAGSGSSAGQPSAGTAPAVEGGTSDNGGSETGGAGGGTMSTAGSTSTAGTNGVGGSPDEVATEWPSFGCGKPFASASDMPLKLATSGTKDPTCADKLNGVPQCGPWSLEREYTLFLPPNYDYRKTHPLVFEAPGCSGTAAGVYAIPGLKDQAIRVGLSPPPKSIGHATNPGQGCFDDREGDDSVDFAFYEALYDELNDTLCFDRHLVFAMGDRSGASLANQLGCKYAGDAAGRMIRGIISHAADLPSQVSSAPTCTSEPMAGLWVYNVDDPTGSSVKPSIAVARAMQVNGCTGASDYTGAVDLGLLQDFPIGGGNPDSSCKRITTCAERYPLVVCALPGQGRTANTSVIEPGTSVFIKQLMTP
jgi:poly(3-hydroxybutyrate) depolymerase